MTRHSPPRAHIFTSARLATDFHLFEAVVGSDASPGAPPRLVLVLDGDDQFTEAVAAARELDAAGAVPPLLLVGLGYGGGYRSPRNRRARDYTPTRLAGEPMETGGATAFHACLETELLPWLATRHAFVPGDSGIIGHSLGALFVLHAAFQPRPLFRRFLASSPSIWWDDRAILAELDPADSAPGSSDRAASARLFLSVGAKDSNSMTGDLKLLAARLESRPRPALAHTVTVFPDHDHFTALGAGFRAGLRWLYADPRGEP